MKYETLEILKEETYRNQPYVNITDNMVRVTLTCSRNEWHVIKRHLTSRSSGQAKLCAERGYHEFKMGKRPKCIHCGYTVSPSA